MLIGLYETTIEQTDTGGDYDVAPGCQFSFELNLTDSIEITVLQMGADQDFSLRCHISKEPGGTSIDLSTPMVSCGPLAVLKISSTFSGLPLSQQLVSSLYTRFSSNPARTI